MIRQVLRNGQITLPREALNVFHLKPQDLVEVEVDRLGIHLRPLIIEEFSEAEYAKLAKKLDVLKRHVRRKVYSTTDQVREHLDRLIQS